jgi:hypothetical protein
LKTLNEIYLYAQETMDIGTFEDMVLGRVIEETNVG